MQVKAIKELISHGESERLKIKLSTGQRTEAAKTVCCMLNNLGGYVFFGVNDQVELVGQRTKRPGIMLKLNLIKQLKMLYCVYMLGFCLMCKHFHVVVRMHPEDEVSNGEIIRRYKKYYGDECKFIPVGGVE